MTTKEPVHIDTIKRTLTKFHTLQKKESESDSEQSNPAPNTYTDMKVNTDKE